MEFTVFTAPPVLSGPSAKPLGPLIFNPSPQTLTLLFSSPSLFPSLPPPPHLSLSRFLRTSDFSSSLPPSLSSSLAAAFGPHYPSPSSAFLDNHLRLLRCPNNSVLAFFPTGENFDQVGYVVLSVQNSTLEARVSDDGDVFLASNKLNHRIIRILVNPTPDSGFGCSGNFNLLGYLMACTTYSVNWFSVGIMQLGLDTERPVLEYLGSKDFKSCAVVHACWSPHLREESIVLLESGELFLFDLESCSKIEILNAKFKGFRLKVSWNNVEYSDNFVWLGCEFSWHPRILIVARSDAVFLVDLRFEECHVSCLVKIEMFGMIGLVEKDPFVVFSRAGSDGFYFTVASKNRLLLCDIRKPLMPVLQWAHTLIDPCFIDVLRLSELRAHSSDDEYKWASESGFCIVMGSFWNCEFCLFFYGPSLPAPGSSVAYKISKFCKSLYAWGLPSDLALSGRGCPCGSCQVREEFSKDALPQWVDWQQKKEIVLGFGMLDRDLSALLFEPDCFGGFTLIRLMSSGKLEAQRYSASWEFAKKFEESHKESPLQFKYSLLYSLGDEEYKFAKRFKYLKLDYLNGYLNNNLTKLLVSNMKKHCKVPWKKESFNADFHELICENLKAFGFIRSGSPAAMDVFSDISLPTSIHEIALRKLWAGLPMDLLQLAFSSYSEFLEVLVDKKKVSLEFLAIPDQPQLPPFFLRKPSCRSNKWSLKVQRGNDLVGPVLSLPILLVLCELRKDGCLDLEQVYKFSPEIEINHQCNEVMVAASEMAVSNLSPKHPNDHAVSLGDDREETWAGSQRLKRFFSYSQLGLLEKCCVTDPMQANSIYKDEKFATLIFKFPEKSHVTNDRMEVVEQELLDDTFPVAMKFDSHAVKRGPKELKSYKFLKRHYSKWQEGFNLYREFRTQFKSQNQDP